MKLRDVALIIAAILILGLILYIIGLPSNDTWMNDINALRDDVYIHITVAEYKDIFKRLEVLEEMHEDKIKLCE
jgi:hypothetical protein